MNIPYRTRRILYWVAVIAAIVLLVGAVAWLCWFTWLSRFVVYTRDGAKIDFSLSQRIPEGQVATPSVDKNPIALVLDTDPNKHETPIKGLDKPLAPPGCCSHGHRGCMWSPSRRCLSCWTMWVRRARGVCRLAAWALGPCPTLPGLQKHPRPLRWSVTLLCITT